MTISVRPLLAYLSLVIGAPAAGRHGAPGAAAVRAHAPDYEPRVRVWVFGDNVFQRGERARVVFRTDDEGFVRGGITYRGSGHGRESFYVDDYPGMGYVFAIAAGRPLDLERLGDGRQWDYRAIGGRVVRDPIVAMQDFAERLVDDPDEPYGLDYAEYYVDRRVEYPRFLCYDCHSYRPYPVWDPYMHVCTRYRVVVYDDPEVYRYNYSPGSRSVYAQSAPRPRYEFKEAPRGSSVTPENFIERRRRAETDDYRRRDARPGQPGGVDRRRRDAEPEPRRSPRSPRPDVDRSIDRDDQRRSALPSSSDGDGRTDRHEQGASVGDQRNPKQRDVARRDDSRRVAPPPQPDDDDSPAASPPSPDRRGRRPPL